MVSLKTLIWPILAVVPPRACLVALNFTQPLLINRSVYLSVDNVTPWTTHVGYGLIGAYILVYVGSAVGILLLYLTSCHRLTFYRSPWANISIGHIGPLPWFEAD
jgi:hypothetical protein